MRLSQIAITLALGLGALFTSSCSKSQAMQRPSLESAALAAAAAGSSATAPRIKDLGIIELTNHYETQISIGQDRTCTITPNVLDRRNLELILSFGTKNAQGKTIGLSVTRVTAEPDRPLDITVNDLDLTFIPKMAAP